MDREWHPLHFEHLYRYDDDQVGSEGQAPGGYWGRVYSLE